MDRRLRLFSLDRFNLTGLRTRSHGDGSARPLKAQVEAHLAAAGMAYGGRVEMLVMPAILGAAFNPLTVFFCHDRAERLSAILYEVNNTFGERHSYLIPAPAEAGPVVSQACEKGFYVSPFMDMDLSYAFRILPPGDQVAVRIEVADAEGPLLTAGFAATRQPLTDKALFRAWFTHPWMTLGVLGAIHWEALRLLLKGQRIRHRPKAPAHPVTVARPA